MKRRRLRVPAALVFAASSATAVVAATTISCGGDDEQNPSCHIYCFEGVTDAGVPPDGGCPLCADVSTGTPTCPSGCTPLG